MTAGILSGNAIREAVEQGDIHIDPFLEKYLNPCSYDLTLGGQVRVYETEDKFGRAVILDTKADNATLSIEISERVGFVLYPGKGYLMHTRERLHTNKFTPVVDGKSSLGRLFIKVHETAGYIDPGFDGQYTLEVTCMHPVRVYLGMRFCQVRFHTIVGEPILYDGNYKGQTAAGAVSSRTWNQFDR